MNVSFSAITDYLRVTSSRAKEFELKLCSAYVWSSPAALFRRLWRATALSVLTPPPFLYGLAIKCFEAAGVLIHSLLPTYGQLWTADPGMLWGLTCKSFGICAQGTHTGGGAYP